MNDYLNQIMNEHIETLKESFKSKTETELYERMTILSITMIGLEKSGKKREIIPYMVETIAIAEVIEELEGGN